MTSGAALLLALVFAAITAFAGEPATGTPNETGARELFRLVNQERQEQGRAPLDWDNRLAQAALQHAYLIAEHKELSHQFANEPSLRLRIAKTSLRLDRSGENLAYDSTILGAHSGLMHSPPHRANILNPDYNAVGIAVVQRGDYFYVVEDFAHRLPESSDTQMEDEIVQAFARARQQAGASPLVHRNSPALRQAACSMARQDQLDAHSVQPSARYVVAFTISDPQHLPADLMNLRANNELGSYAIGVCFERSPTYPSGVYWAVMTFFQKGSGKGQ